MFEEVKPLVLQTDNIQDIIKEYKVLTDYRTPKQKEVDDFLNLLENGTPKKWAIPFIYILKKIILK